MKCLEALYVTWIDSQTDHGWKSHNDLDHTPALMHAVGWLIHSNDEMICLSISSDFEECNPVQWIPRACIQKIAPLLAINCE